VELDEIDSILSLHPSIEFASVIVRISEGGENQLVAYVLPKENVRLPTVHELQQHLLGSLPDYMIPAVFARLHALPISVNGKLDLNMLEPPTDADLLEGADAEGPAAPIKEKLLAMVRELLENEAIAAKDNFFLAGGHSLLGMQFVMRLRNTFGVDLALQQLFEAPTVERLALLIEVMFQKRLALIWAELLGRKCVSVDDNFFDLSGDLSLAEALQRRIAAEFGQFIPIGELSQYATIRKQTELAVSKMIGPALPHGVIALQPHGARNSIFWIDYACAEDLALEIGEGQPVLAVVLTADDYASLGEAPKLESIAACLLRKILAVQSTGPYIIGGFCLGGIIGYEIASQMRAAGHEVSLVVLLDAPNPTYLDRCNSLSRKVSYLRYVLRRAVRLGPRTSFVYLRERLPKRLATSLRIISANTQMRSTREKMNVAARAYQPKHCDGKVLLLLASERPPHVNFVPGWQAVVPLNLHTQYVDGHHRDIGKGKNIRGVAHIIVSHLMSAADDKFSLAAPALPGPRSLVQMGNPATYRFDQGQGGEGATQASTPLTE
jgi:thioesterase domain-containing protein/aryl carrier-like protein